MKYPGGVKSIRDNTFNNITYGNRGMDLEYEINITNEYYREKDIAIIYKKPTPVKVNKVDYKSHNKKIKEAFFESPSTTDYNGVYKGRYIDFEAKETNNKTSFPLSNIHKHQIEHIKKIIKHNGICFIIVRFKKINKTYLLLGEDLKLFLDNNIKKSIPLRFFEEKGYILKDKYMPRIDYLEIIDKIMEVPNGKE